jgi:hypothetical protein
MIARRNSGALGDVDLHPCLQKQVLGEANIVFYTNITTTNTGTFKGPAG